MLIYLTPKTFDGGAVHDLVLGNGVFLVVGLLTGPCRLPLDDLKLHVLDLHAHQQKVYLADDGVLQVVP